jgi:hypothetical protein
MPAKASKAKASAPKRPAARERPPPSAPGKKKPTASLRKPPAPKSVDDFVTGSGQQETPPAPRSVTPKTSAPPKSRTLVARKDGTERRRTTVYFEPELFKRLNVYCAQQDLEISQVVGEAVEAFLGRQPG